VTIELLQEGHDRLSHIEKKICHLQQVKQVLQEAKTNRVLPSRVLNNNYRHAKFSHFSHYLQQGVRFFAPNQCLLKKKVEIVKLNLEAVRVSHAPVCRDMCQQVGHTKAAKQPSAVFTDKRHQIQSFSHRCQRFQQRIINVKTVNKARLAELHVVKLALTPLLQRDSRHNMAQYRQIPL
jgi:tRNA A37 threonylcarbamoyladenosine synthetase subunit TsaC/SUA5/YrdC